MTLPHLTIIQAVIYAIISLFVGSASITAAAFAPRDKLDIGIAAILVAIAIVAVIACLAFLVIAFSLWIGLS